MRSDRLPVRAMLPGLPVWLGSRERRWFPADLGEPREWVELPPELRPGPIVAKP